MTTTATFPVTVGSNTINVNVDGVTTLESLCEKIAPFETLLTAPSKCSACDSGNLLPVHRKAGPKGEFDFYEVLCVGCGAKLKIHQKKAGGTYIKREETFEKFTPKEGTADTGTIELDGE